MNSWSEVNLPPFGLFWRYGAWLRGLTLAMIVAGAILPCAGHLWIALAMLLPAAVILRFFRCPRRVFSGEAKLVSPADGLVDDLEPVDDCPVIGGPALRIGIFLSVFDVHVTRAPVSGRVKAKQFIPGHFGNAMSRGAGSRNQRNEIIFETGAGKPIFMRQISGAIARRVVFDPAPGDTVRTGAVVGMIRFGSRVELFVPLDSGFEILVRQGERVRSGATVIGRPIKNEVLSLKESQQR